MGMMIRNDSEDADICVLPEWFTPSDRDVICGWARQYQGHAGNERFRKLVQCSAPRYLAAKTKLEKTQVIASVVEKVRRDSCGGGFVKQDGKSGLWYEIGDDKARDKVGHAIRRFLDYKPHSKAVANSTKKQEQCSAMIGSRSKTLCFTNTKPSVVPMPSLDNFAHHDEAAQDEVVIRSDRPPASNHEQHDHDSSARTNTTSGANEEFFMPKAACTQEPLRGDINDSMVGSQPGGTLNDKLQPNVAVQPSTFLNGTLIRGPMDVGGSSMSSLIGNRKFEFSSDHNLLLPIVRCNQTMTVVQESTAGGTEEGSDGFPFWVKPLQEEGGGGRDPRNIRENFSLFGVNQPSRTLQHGNVSNEPHSASSCRAPTIIASSLESTSGAGSKNMDPSLFQLSQATCLGQQPRSLLSGGTLNAPQAYQPFPTSMMSGGGGEQKGNCSNVLSSRGGSGAARTIQGQQGGGGSSNNALCYGGGSLVVGRPTFPTALPSERSQNYARDLAATSSIVNGNVTNMQGASLSTTSSLTISNKKTISLLPASSSVMGINMQNVMFPMVHREDNGGSVPRPSSSILTTMMSPPFLPGSNSGAETMDDGMLIRGNSLQPQQNQEQEDVRVPFGFFQLNHGLRSNDVFMQEGSSQQEPTPMMMAMMNSALPPTENEANAQDGNDDHLGDALRLLSGRWP